MALPFSCQGCRHAVFPAACCACKTYDGWTPVNPPTQGAETDPRYDESELTTSVGSSGPEQASELGPGWAGTPSEEELAPRCAAPIKVDPGPDPKRDEADHGCQDPPEADMYRSRAKMCTACRWFFCRHQRRHPCAACSRNTLHAVKDGSDLWETAHYEEDGNSTSSVDPPVPGQALEFGPAWAEAKTKSRELFERFKDMSEQERARLALRCAAPIEVDPDGGVSSDPSADPEGAAGSVDSKIAHGSQKSEPFRRALTDVWRVSLFGERKHGANNWQSAVAEGMHFYEDALWRHLQARRMGEVCADDSGLPHLAHLAWNALMLLEMESRGVTNPEWGPSPEGSNDP